MYPAVLLEIYRQSVEQLNASAFKLIFSAFKQVVVGKNPAQEESSYLGLKTSRDQPLKSSRRPNVTTKKIYCYRTARDPCAKELSRLNINCSWISIDLTWDGIGIQLSKIPGVICCYSKYTCHLPFWEDSRISRNADPFPAGRSSGKWHDLCKQNLLVLVRAAACKPRQARVARQRQEGFLWLW